MLLWIERKNIKKRWLLNNGNPAVFFTNPSPPLSALIRVIRGSLYFFIINFPLTKINIHYTLVMLYENTNRRRNMIQDINTHVNEIILYQPNNAIKMEVRLENETVWLTQAQMVELFQRDQSVISRHINNVFKEKELTEECNMHFLHIANADRPTTFYSLDVIISVGYRVKSQRGTHFRQWANRILKEYLLKGYSVNQRFYHFIQTGR
jgi:hypothetical protein